ncbi:lipoxygenase 3, chloroplastic-like isoform X2 [Prosopis cineraria]|uniref:lipoxygenase 3, chloroplastic-like isoform X2 n=1 Tax=Prosopis cineraria TaxID=364024 RepID=UPI00240F15ED|nr:lipoxygenase 3, chloroplastic-like isoform X2 [Prosopis cineraria]
MTLTKEIVGQSMVEAFRLDASKKPFYFKRCTKQQHRISLPPTFNFSVHTTKEQKKKVVPQSVSPLSTFTEGTESRRGLPARKPVLETATVTLTAMVTIKNSKHAENEMMSIMLQHFEAFNKTTSGRAMVMQLVSTEVDPRTMEPKVSKNAVLECTKDVKVGNPRTTYKVEFEIDSDFGLPGAITVVNKCEKEFFLENIVVEGIFHFPCNSWVQPEKLHPEKRIFFTNKVHLPWETPAGLRDLRKEELRQARGDGEGVRKHGDRIYDFEVYNDLGNADKTRQDHLRPTFGGHQYPFPRRCRTDQKVESPVNAFNETYVPRDEVFDKIRIEALDVERTKGITRNLIPFFKTCVTKCGTFKQLSDVTSIYNGKCEGASNKIQDSLNEYFKFSTPNIIRGNNSGFCIRDEELGRQTLAGINPLSIKKLETFPPKSDLDPSLCGSQESALKEEHILPFLHGMSVKEALEEKKLFILDYHDAYIPFLKGINAQEDRKAYATRTIFFLTRLGTLKPIAIELSLPEGYPNHLFKQVLTPPEDSNSYWLWQLGKAHVCSNDSGVHQLVQHWLRTHACMEPFIIAAHRQLSVMHPVFKLLKPHMKDTLQINALAREALINAGGIIESDLSCGKYCNHIVSAAYKDWWRFDMEALPNDLIRRGLAEPDQTKPYGLKLLIEDYPYANDGLPIWFAIEKWVRTYVTYYYRDGLMVQSDYELQAWYSEVINVGHADHKHASWWPKLSTPSDLISVLTTLIWIASVQHSAVNFGQYPYGGYVPMRPPLMKRLLPKEDDREYKEFMKDPEGYLLSSMPNLFQTTKFLTVVNILSQHSTEEEYLGQRKNLSDWSDDHEIIEAFYRLSMELKRIEKEIEKRNKDTNLRNRYGAGIPPYELLMASSGPGATCRGVPNSISI